jgi:histidinol-phosphate/aromatic aminotransferase/cobyric acid decarboxylase-like protein
MSNYGSCQRLLNEKLSYLTLLPPEKLVLLNGAAQAFPILKNWFYGKKAALPYPTFGEYARIFPNAANYLDNEIGCKDDFLSVSAREDIDVVVVVNPNNPTGSIMPSACLLKEMTLRRDKFFVIDESFIDFSSDVSMESFGNSAGDNFIIIKSLSKVLGVPGIRLGYVFTNNRAIHDYFMDNLPVWNVNSISEFLLEVLLKHRKSFAHSVMQTKIDRESFSKMLMESPAVKKVFPSSANFLLVKLCLSSKQINFLVSRLLNEHGIYVKSISEKFSDGFGYLRLAVRFPSENAALVEALTKISKTIS